MVIFGLIAIPFDPDGSPGALIPAAYADRIVTAASGSTMPPQNIPIAASFARTLLRALNA